MDKKSDIESENAIQQFAEITQTDEAFAHFVLQEVDYDLNRALKDYFDNCPAISSNDILHDKILTSQALINEDDFPNELTLLSWNIDGLDEISQNKRFTAVLHVIANVNPEIIFLQEVVNQHLKPLDDLLGKMYNTFISDPKAPYFCVTLVSKNIMVKASEVIPLQNSEMLRSATIVEAKWQNLRIKLINTHLESLAEYSNTRKSQLLQCMERMKTFISENPVEKALIVMGGDLNIRDSEIQNLPKSVNDAWLAAGSPKNDQYTWDTRRNDNKQARFARCRFDRIYFVGPYEKIDFKLDGTERIRGVNCFPSDHFALVCRFYSKK